MCIRDSSPIIGSIKVIRSGKVKKAKLYYLRDRKGKSARISEKIKKKIGIDISEQADDNEIVNENVVIEGQSQEKVKIKVTKTEKKETILKTKPKKEDSQKEVLGLDTKKEKLKTKKK